MSPITALIFCAFVIWLAVLIVKLDRAARVIDDAWMPEEGIAGTDRGRHRDPSSGFRGVGTDCPHSPVPDARLWCEWGWAG